MTCCTCTYNVCTYIMYIHNLLLLFLFVCSANVDDKEELRERGEKVQDSKR